MKLLKCALSLFIVSISMVGEHEAAPATELTTPSLVTSTPAVTEAPGLGVRSAVTVNPGGAINGNGTDAAKNLKARSGELNLAYCLNCIESCQMVGNALEYCESDRCAIICRPGGNPVRPPPTDTTTQGVIRPPPVTRPPYDDGHDGHDTILCTICQG